MSEEGVWRQRVNQSEHCNGFHEPSRPSVCSDRIVTSQVNAHVDHAVKEVLESIGHGAVVGTSIPWDRVNAVPVILVFTKKDGPSKNDPKRQGSKQCDAKRVELQSDNVVC